MGIMAHLCNSCGFGNKAGNCILCGKPFAKKAAVLCNSCGFGNKATECVECGKPFAKIAAHLCDSCDFRCVLTLG